MNVLTNANKYQAMVDALNEFYWDNGISPNATASMLDTFAGEVSKLAQFIRDNDPRGLTKRAADGVVCTCKIYLPSLDSFVPKCSVCGLPPRQ